MTPRHYGTVSRKQAGLVPPTSVSTNVNPSLGGVAWHYLGFNPGIQSHSDCVSRWRSVQAGHIGQGWADIGYNVGICPHGYVLAGRGWGVRSAAQGTNDGNFRFLAICLLTGGAISTRMLEATLWVTQEFRKGGAGREVRPHSYFKATACPGNAGRAEAAKYHNQDITVEDEMNAAQEALLQAVAEQILGRAEQPARQRATSGRPTLRDMVFNVDGNLRAGDNVRKQYVYVEELGQAYRNGELGSPVINVEDLADAIVARLPAGAIDTEALTETILDALAARLAA